MKGNIIPYSRAIKLFPLDNLSLGFLHSTAAASHRSRSQPRDEEGEDIDGQIGQSAPRIAGDVCEYCLLF